MADRLGAFSVTTDVSEQTEVQPEVAPEGQLAPPDNAEPTTQADAAAQPDASQETGEQEPALPEDPAEYVKSVLEKEGQDGQPETQQRKPLIDPEQARQGLEAYRNAHRDRQRAFDDMRDRLIEAGYSKLETEAIIKDSKDILNSHHADALKYAGYEASSTALAEVGQSVWEGIDALPKPVSESVKTAFNDAAKSSPNGEVPYSDVIKIIAERSQEIGRKDGYAKGLEKGFTDGRSARDATASGASSGQSVNGRNPTSSDNRSEDAILMDPDVPQSRKDDILRKRGVL